jgi:hypothetical protein
VDLSNNQLKQIYYLTCTEGWEVIRTVLDRMASDLTHQMVHGKLEDLREAVIFQEKIKFLSVFPAMIESLAELGKEIEEE